MNDTTCLFLNTTARMEKLTADFSLYNQTLTDTIMTTFPSNICYEMRNNMSLCANFFNFVFTPYGLIGSIELQIKNKTVSFMVMHVGAFNFANLIGHNYFIKDVVSIYTNNSVEYFSRYNPLVFTPPIFLF